MKKIIYLLVILIMPLSIEAQKVFIDQPIRIGEFIVFPTVDDPNAYYYFPGNPRIARTKDGKPQFSFTLFTEKNRSNVDEESIEDQAGGGVIHALVEYGLTNTEIEKLRGLLKTKNKSAILKGPIMFKSGNIAIISAIADGSKKIIGVGKAPLLEGNKAAIAFELDKKGAQRLWGTFQTSTPDISFKFEMEMPGYLSPIRGYVKGDFKDVYEAHDMSLAVSGSLGPITLGVEIGATLDKLEKDGKIEVYTEGDDKERDKLIAYGYNKLVDMLFVSTDQSYNQMVNNDPGQKKSGFDQLEKVNKLQSKFNTESEKGESYEEHEKKNAGTKSSQNKQSKSKATEPQKKVLDPHDGEGENNKLVYFEGLDKNNKKIYFKKYAGGVSIGKEYKSDFFENILKELEVQDRLIYEKKHNDLIKIKYKERWTKNNPVKVSKKHIIAVLNNYKAAQYESENNPVKFKKWLKFYPTKGNVKEVAMEAWRFRGLVEMTYSNKVRGNLRRMVNAFEEVKDDYRGVEPNASIENLATTSDAFDLVYEDENEKDLVTVKYRKKWADPDGNQEINVSKYHVLAILNNCQQATRELERYKGKKWVFLNPKKGDYKSFDMEYWRFGGLVDMCNDPKVSKKLRNLLNEHINNTTATNKDDYRGVEPNASIENLATTSDAFDLVYEDENEKDLVTVKYRKKWADPDGNQEINVSKYHVLAILNNCQQATRELERYKGKKWVFLNPKKGDYSSFDMEYWRFGGLVDMCNDPKVSKKLRNLLNERINNEKINDNRTKIERGEGKGGSNPNNYFNYNEYPNEQNYKRKGGPSLDNYFNYDEYLNELSEKEFLNQIPILNSSSPVKGTPMGISIYGSYRYRKTKKEGTYKLEFKKVKSATRFLRFDENIGNIKKECKKCFSVVNLDEMKQFKQREVLALLDGAVLSNFKNFINSASIQLKKVRPNGYEELDDATIKYTDFNRVGDIDKKVTGNIRKLVYGWKNDPDDTWGNYKYKIDWSYYSNLKISGEWKDADANVITVSSPLTLKTLTIEADPDFAEDNGIKYIIVNIEYPYGDKVQRGYVDFDKGGKFTHKAIKLKPSTGILSKEIGVILPNDVDEVSYTYTVITNDKEEFTSKPKKSQGLYIFGIDSIPKEKKNNEKE